MGANHAVVQRILLESLGIVDPPEGVTLSVPVLQPPAQLDMCPQFADDGLLAGKTGEIVRTLRHLNLVMPGLGLRFSKLDAIPAAGNQSTIDVHALQQVGCKINLSKEFSVMQSPIGSVGFCDTFLQKKTDKAAKILSAIGELPDAHCALFLLRHQTGRMDYIARTTPLESCKKGL